MKSSKTLLYLIFACFVSFNLMAQTTTKHRYTNHILLLAADSLLCNKDTLNSIRYLEEFLENVNKDGRGYSQNNDCKSIADRLSPSSMHADVCLVISELCLKTDNPSKSLEYISKAKTDFSPRYGGCLNGIWMYKTKISLYEANHHLEYGERDKAINSLLEFFIYQEPYSIRATDMLKQLLDEKYSKKEIEEIVDKAIDTIVINEKGHAQINLFDLVITLWSRSSIEDAKAYCRESMNLNTIRE